MTRNIYIVGVLKAVDIVGIIIKESARRKNITANNLPKQIDCGGPDYVVRLKVKNLDQTIGYFEANTRNILRLTN